MNEAAREWKRDYAEAEAAVAIGRCPSMTIMGEGQYLGAAGRRDAQAMLKFADGSARSRAYCRAHGMYCFAGGDQANLAAALAWLVIHGYLTAAAVRP